MVKAVLLPFGLVTPVGDRGTQFLIYHRVSGDQDCEIDLDPVLFQEQVRFLLGLGRISALEEALEVQEGGRKPHGQSTVLTFDDGYLDFYRTVFPLLKELGVPATLYVTTGFIESRACSPLSRGLPPQVQPLTWGMLRELHASGLVTIGAHSHAHRDYPGMTKGEVEEDIERSSALFARHLGFVPRHFAYPRARFDAASEAVVKRHYDSAAVGGVGSARGSDFDRYRIPRVPVRRSDGMFFFRTKVRGRLRGEERVYEMMRAALRR
jgi:peptidoglycan/xylan/chitin deacetylase (PgdA/CDA1 family)